MYRCDLFLSIPARVFRIQADYGNGWMLPELHMVHAQLFLLGCFDQRHAGKVLFLGLFVLVLCCAAMSQARVETDIDKLWVQGQFDGDTRSRRCY